VNFRRVAVAAGLVGLALTAAPAADAQPAPDDDVRSFPIAQGNYTSAGDFYWVFFKTPDGRSCGIGPNGGPVGCDAVPVDIPQGVNQTIVNSWAPAEYRYSDIPAFTRAVDVLREGQRLESWGASCGVDHEGAVHCETYNNHGFVLSTDYGELW
jgi:hypothetical protein